VQPDTPCAPGDYCDRHTGGCTRLKAPGDGCTDPNECASNICPFRQHVCAHAPESPFFPRGTLEATILFGIVCAPGLRLLRRRRAPSTLNREPS
jgi:hypothetical protein